MAREVILFIAASIDGFIADKAGGVAWLEENIRGDEEDRSYDEMYEKIDTVVMGRTTYDQVTQELSPDVYFYEDKHSYIITSHPEPSTASRTFTKEDPVTLIRRLKEEDGAGIWIVGGPKVVQPLLAADDLPAHAASSVARPSAGPVHRADGPASVWRPAAG